jgi:Transposase zinc-binding domain
MNQPAVEVADLLRAQGSRFLEQYQSSFGYQKLKVFRALHNCRTSALGGHLDSCSKCGRQAISYNSCRNRHCPKCQAHARQRWLEAREREVLPIEYFYVVFSVPARTQRVCAENPRCFYELLFSASVAATLELAADPKHLGADIGFISILHTWGQTLLLNPHS